MKKILSILMCILVLGLCACDIELPVDSNPSENPSEGNEFEDLGEQNSVSKFLDYLFEKEEAQPRAKMSMKLSNRVKLDNTVNPDYERFFDLVKAEDVNGVGSYQSLKDTDATLNTSFSNAWLVKSEIEHKLVHSELKKLKIYLDNEGLSNVNIYNKRIKCFGYSIIFGEPLEDGTNYIVYTNDSVNMIYIYKTVNDGQKYIYSLCDLSGSRESYVETNGDSTISSCELADERSYTDIVTSLEIRDGYGYYDKAIFDVYQSKYLKDACPNFIAKIKNKVEENRKILNEIKSSITDVLIEQSRSDSEDNKWLYHNVSHEITYDNGNNPVVSAIIKQEICERVDRDVTKNESNDVLYIRYADGTTFMNHIRNIFYKNRQIQLTYSYDELKNMSPEARAELLNLDGISTVSIEEPSIVLSTKWCYTCGGYDNAGCEGEICDNCFSHEEECICCKYCHKYECVCIPCDICGVKGGHAEYCPGECEICGKPLETFNGVIGCMGHCEICGDEFYRNGKCINCELCPECLRDKEKCNGDCPICGYHLGGKKQCPDCAE